MRIPRSPAFAVVMLAAASSTSCFDPVHSDDVAALGGETGGVGPGPRHRPGQPCRTCHGGQGPGNAEFSIAGTVYANRDKGVVKPGVTVVLTDANGNGPPGGNPTTNTAGNFYLTVAQWSPQFPVFVTLVGKSAAGADITRSMISGIGRNGGCAFCHYGADNEATHMPPVFLEN